MKTSEFLRTFVTSWFAVVDNRTAPTEGWRAARSASSSAITAPLWSAGGRFTRQQLIDHDPRLKETASADQIKQFGDAFAGRTPQSVASARDEWHNLQKNVAPRGGAIRPGGRIH